MIRRERNPELVNELVGRDFPGLDFSEVLSEPLHICLIDGESGAIFAWRGPHTYEAHVFYAVRGREALNLGRDMLAYMHTLGGNKFYSLIPVENKAAKLFVRLLGWKSGGLFTTKHGKNELFTLEFEPCLQQ